MTEKIVTTKIAVCSYIELTEEQKKLIDMAREATKNSYAPYSNYHVGAALMLDNGVCITGANQENASFPAGICGERAAIFTAGAQYPGEPVKILAITAEYRRKLVPEPIAPCGVCRQAILEFEKNAPHPIQIVLGASDSFYVVNSIADLLPLCFKEF